MKRHVGLFDGAVNMFWGFMCIAWVHLDLRLGIPEWPGASLLASVACTLVMFCCFAAILESRCRNWRLFARLAASMLVAWFLLNLLLVWP